MLRRVLPTCACRSCRTLGLSSHGCAAAGRVELRAADSPASAIELPAAKVVELKPGGLHLLLMDLERPLLKGERIVLLLRFDRVGDLRIDAEVQSAESKRSRH
jgi:hypothetical protein